MRVLHTGDWHLGKVLKGEDRLPEQQLVMAEIVEIARRESVDVVLMAGDVYETSAPPAAAQALAWKTFLALRAIATHVVVLAGNHDHAESFDALAPVAAAAGVTLVGRPRGPADGGVLALTAGGHTALVACLPFVSQRGVVKAAELMDLDSYEAVQRYADRVRAVLSALCSGFSAATVNIVLAHAMVTGGTLGGGERDAQTVFDYAVPSTAFPVSAQYVALGHLHRQQRLPAACPTWYSGSPICVDFGETANEPAVLVVDAEPGMPVAVRSVPLTTARALRTITGTLTEVAEQAPGLGDALVKVIITEPGRAGLADDVRRLIPNALDIRVEGAHPQRSSRAGRATGRSPHQQFEAFMAEQGLADPALQAMFAELLEADAGGGHGAGAAGPP